jgi:hypothetical protein
MTGGTGLLPIYEPVLRTIHPSMKAVEFQVRSGEKNTMGGTKVLITCSEMFYWQLGGLNIPSVNGFMK